MHVLGGTRRTIAENSAGTTMGHLCDYFVYLEALFVFSSFYLGWWWLTVVESWEFPYT